MYIMLWVYKREQVSLMICDLLGEIKIRTMWVFVIKKEKTISYYIIKIVEVCCL